MNTMNVGMGQVLGGGVNYAQQIEQKASAEAEWESVTLGEMLTRQEVELHSRLGDIENLRVRCAPMLKMTRKELHLLQRFL